ncbi:hypothetical protein PIB30_033592 [Stylosanthes scabra]|uniref:Uncharacterized protein n=1 Tax=Stylosanthes scabra TaxID=79078 RepID=A0ABU6YAY5_9FABA|nr:hypothetical protein [Stylosanthes scabra]
MASQLAINTRCQTLIHCTASYGERGRDSSHPRRSGCTLSHRYRRIRNLSDDDNNGTTPPPQPQPQQDLKNKEHKKQQQQLGGREQAEKLHRLGFSYLASSFIYLVTKFKAFCNGFLGDVPPNHQPNVTMEPPLTEPYFSFPRAIKVDDTDRGDKVPYCNVAQAFGKNDILPYIEREMLRIINTLACL